MMGWLHTKLISVNVSKSRTLEYKGRPVTTGIFKKPVSGSIRMKTLSLDGDEQADLTVHGGPDKAVYLYPVEHYPYWIEQYPDIEMKWGMFGENLTAEGLLEDGVNIGDMFQIGSAKVVVTQPRMPCYKLAMKFDRNDIIKKFLVSGRSGLYFKILEEGDIQAGDEINLISKDENKVSIKDIVRIYAHDLQDKEVIERATRVEALPEGWKDYFLKML